MTFLLFNSNSVWFKTPPDIELGKQIRDGDLFTVQCEYYSWPVNDIHQQWGVDDFPDKPALRIAMFTIQPAPDDLPCWTDDRMRSDFYWVLLHHMDRKNDTPIPVLCDAVDKQFFGVATDKESEKKLTDNWERMQVIIPVQVKIVDNDNGNDKWANFCVHRQSSDSWALAEMKFV